MIMLHLYIPRYPDFERVVVYRHTLCRYTCPNHPVSGSSRNKQPPRHVRGGGSACGREGRTQTKPPLTISRVLDARA